MKHLSEKPDALALSSISAALRSTILKSLDKRPEARPDLRESANDRTRIEPDPREPTAGSPARPRAFALPAAGLAILIVMLAYVAFWKSAAPGASPIASPSVSPLAAPSFAASPADGTGSETAPVVTKTISPAIGASPRVAPKAPPPSATPIPPVEASPAPVPLEGPPPEPRAATTPTPAPTAHDATPAGTPASPIEARLFVDAKPWAEVFVDGDRKGLTPFPALVLAPGSHMVELRHPDFRPFRRTIELKAGEQSRLSVNLRLEAIRR